MKKTIIVLPLLFTCVFSGYSQTPIPGRRSLGRISSFRARIQEPSLISMGPSYWKVYRWAGAIEDPGRMAGNFAGVTTAGIHLNAIVVRGNAPKGLLWRLEGMDIPVPSHFAGSNVVNEKNLLSINFKFTFMGPFWHHPVDESATELTGEMIYAEDQPFTFRYSNFENIMT